MTVPHVPLLIGLTGRAGAGKSTVAAWLEDEWAFHQVAFADPLLNMLGSLFADCGIGGEWMTERTLKERPTSLGFSYRQLAQTLGTEWARNTLAPDFWLRVAAHRLDSLAPHGDHVVISDVRFPNEADWLKQRGGVLVRVVRDITPAVHPHESEAHVDQLPVDTELLNFGSKDTLHDQVDSLLCTLRKRAAA
jgi:hypothetical protein